MPKAPSAEDTTRLLEEAGKSIIYHIPHALFLIDKQGKILYANENVQKIFGYRPEEVVGKPLSLIFTPEDMEILYPNLLFLANNNSSFYGELMLLKRNQAKFFAYLNMLPQAEQDSCIICIQDIDDTKKLKQIVDIGNYDDLVKMANGIAHEIRNPLMSLGGFINRINKICNLDSTNAHYYETIIANLNRIETILKKVQLFVTLPKPEFKRWNIRLIVNDALENRKHDLEKKQIKVTNLVEEKVVFADYQLMKTCFVIFIDNSIDAISHNQGMIRIASESDENILKLSFSDNGSGISPSDLPYIFVPFFSTKAHGVGIDLAIAKKIILAHNGTISVNSVVGEGTCLEVLFPIERRRKIRRELFCNQGTG